MNKINMAARVMMPLALSIAGASAVLCSSIAFAADVNVVDIIVVYDEATDVDIQAGAETYINQIVAYTNKAFEMSDINLQLRLVHSQKIEVPGVTQVSERGLGNLADNQTIQQLRDDYGADLVSMLAPGTGTLQTGKLCGIAYVGMGDKGKFYNNSKNTAYSLVGYDCGAATFAHEIGHNLGLGHSRLQGDRGGVFDYGLGHGVEYSFSTIMTYPQRFGVRNTVDYFSNPRLNICDGGPCGIPAGSTNSADAASAINQVSSQIVDWRATKVVAPQPGTPDPIDNNNGTGGTDTPIDNGDAEIPSDVNDSAVAVDGISVSPQILTTLVGDVNQLNPKVSPANATNQQVTFVSQNSAVATVDNSGLVYSMSRGETTIVATTDEGQYYAEMSIKVLDAIQDASNKAAAEPVFKNTGSLSHVLFYLFGMLVLRRKR